MSGVQLFLILLGHIKKVLSNLIICIVSDSRTADPVHS